MLHAEREARSRSCNGERSAGATTHFIRGPRSRARWHEPVARRHERHERQGGRVDHRLYLSRRPTSSVRVPRVGAAPAPDHRHRRTSRYVLAPRAAGQWPRAHRVRPAKRGIIPAAPPPAAHGTTRPHCRSASRRAATRARGRAGLLVGGRLGTGARATSARSCPSPRALRDGRDLAEARHDRSRP